MRNLAPTFSNITPHLIDKQNRLASSVESRKKLLVISKEGSFYLFHSLVQVSLDFSKLSCIFARCFNHDLWAAWQQQEKIFHSLAHFSKNLSAGNRTTAPLKRKLYRCRKKTQLNSTYIIALYILLQNSSLKKGYLRGKFQFVR